MSEEEKEAIEILKDDIVAYAVGHEKYENAVKIAVNLIDKLQKENEELSESNFHFLEINQKLIEEKPIIKELTEKEFNLLKENEELKEDNKKLCAEISDLKELLGE